MRVMVTGGAGYVGSWLVPQLLGDGHLVTVYDTLWFGDGFLPKDNPHLRVVQGDIRDLNALKRELEGIEAVIHLACVSNDTSCQLDEALSTAINYDAFEPLVVAAKEAGVRRFIYCSSSSVYGVSHAPDVFEDHPLVPLTLYNKYKGLCEPLLFKHQSPEFVCTIIRPATVCGYAPRQRFDLTVNIMTMHAVMKGVITVFGGEQKRPNLHIQDMSDCYRLLLKVSEDKIAGEIFNVGRQNLKVREIAQMIARVVGKRMGKFVPITIAPSQDNRSYHVNSEKIARVLDFRPQFSVERAIEDLCVQFQNGNFRDALTNPWYTNVVQLIERHGYGTKHGFGAKGTV